MSWASKFKPQIQGDVFHTTPQTEGVYYGTTGVLGGREQAPVSEEIGMPIRQDIKDVEMVPDAPPIQPKEDITDPYGIERQVWGPRGTCLGTLAILGGLLLATVSMILVI